MSENIINEEAKKKRQEETNRKMLETRRKNAELKNINTTEEIKDTKPIEENINKNLPPRKRGTFGGAKGTFDHPPIEGYYLRYCDISGGNLKFYQDTGFEFVKDEKQENIKTYGGVGIDGRPYDLYLMKQPIEYRNQDMQDLREHTLNRGVNQIKESINKVGDNIYGKKITI